MNQRLTNTHTQTYAIGTGAGSGPAVQAHPLARGDQSRVRLTAWRGSFGSSNVYLFEGDVTLADAQAYISDAVTMQVDCVMCITGAGPVSAEVSGDCQRVTLFFEIANTSGQTQAVTIKTEEYR